MLYFWSEMIPNWIMAAGAAGTAIVLFWRRQDRKEAMNAQVARINDSINAAWVKVKVDDDPEEKWGILVTNTLKNPVSDVKVECTGNAMSEELRHRILYPGEHFFASSAIGQTRPWALPTIRFEIIEYITSTRRYKTTKIDFVHSGMRHSKVLDEVAEKEQAA